MASRAVSAYNNTTIIDSVGACDTSSLYLSISSITSKASNTWWAVLALDLSCVTVFVVGTHNWLLVRLGAVKSCWAAGTRTCVAIAELSFRARNWSPQKDHCMKNLLDKQCKMMILF